MLRRLLVLVTVLGLIGGALFWFLTMPASVPASALPAHTPDIDNGRTMFFAGGCASCHATPGQQEPTLLGGGLGLPSPFGTFHVPNISAHRTDGIGAWSEADFVTAMTKGTSPRGSHYYPAFPFTSYQRMRVADLRDLFAFMKTVPEVAGQVRGHDLPFPFNVRRGLGLWKLLYLDGEEFRPDPQQSDAWNRGAYLVNGPAHCAECHSPRDFSGGIISARRFAGGPNPEGKGSVPDITQAGLKDWTIGDIEEVLGSGMTPAGDFVGSNMAPVVRNTARLTPDDRRAMAVYIKSLPPVAGPAR